MQRKQKNAIQRMLGCMCMIMSMTLSLFGCAKIETGNVKEYSTQTQAEDSQEYSTQTQTQTEDVQERGVLAETEQQEDAKVDLQQLLTSEMEGNVRELYLDKMTIEAAVRTLIADRLNTTSFYEVDARERYDITEVLIDELSGNPIVSEGVKAMIHAASDEKSLSEIVNETVQGAGSGVSDYLTGEVQGVITDAIGIDVFSAIDFVDKWKNADSTPTVLLQKIVDDQKADVAKLDAFLQQQEMNAADILKLSQLVYCIHIREQEIHDITGEVGADSCTDYMQLEKLARQYAQLEEEICAYAVVTFPENLSELTEEEKSNLQTAQEEAAALINESQQLNELSIGHIAVNYDVKGFMEAQVSTSQTGQMADAFLGDVWGQIATEDMQMVEDSVQEKRGTLYNKLTDYMEESFQQVAEAKSEYDGKTAVLQWICDAQGDELYLVKCFLENTDWQNEYESVRSSYVDMLEKYLFDLACAYQFYECTLTQNQSVFLSEIRQELDNVQKCVEIWDSEKLAGYSKEDKNERYQDIIELYVESEDYIQVRGAALGQTPGFHDGGQVTKYGEGQYCAYVNGESTVLVIRLRTGEYLSGGGGVRSYYDMEGNPIYCCAGQDWVSFFDNEVMAYQLMNDDFLSSYWETADKAFAVFN